MTASLREKLRARQLRSTTYPLAVEDTSEAETAVQRAQEAYRFALLEHQDENADEVKKARKSLDKAEKAEAACYEHVTVRALNAADFEALVDAHPPQGEERGDVPWHTETFRPALLAACVESDMTEEDWAEHFRTNGTTGGQ